MSSAADVEVPENPASSASSVHGAVRFAGVAALTIGLVAGAEFLSRWSHGYVRADLVVLTVIFAESRRWVVRVLAAVAAVAMGLVEYGFDGASAERAVLSILISAAAAWVLVRSGTTRRSAPAARFFLTWALLVVVCTAGALLQMAVHWGFDEATQADTLAVRFFRAFVPITCAVMVAAAVWARTTPRYTRALSRLSLGFVIAAAGTALPYATAAYWGDQERQVLEVAATTAGAALDTNLNASIGAYVARAETQPRAPFVNQAGFAAVNQPLLVGDPLINALGLLQPEGDGYSMIYEIDRQGSTPALGALMGAAPADSAAVKAAQEAGVKVSLGVRDIPASDAQPAPHLVFVTPQKLKDGSPALLAAAISVREAMSVATASVGPDAGRIHFVINATETPDATEPTLRLDFGPAAIPGSLAVASPQPVGFGNGIGTVSAMPAEGLGPSRAQQLTILGSEIVIALIALLLFLQSANSRFRAQRSLEEREALLAAAIEAAPGRVMLIDSSQRVVMSNSDLEGDSTPVVGKPAVDSLPFIVVPEERDRIGQVMAGALAGSVGTTEYVDMSSSETLRIHEITATPVAAREDVPASALVQVVDVTDVRAAAMRDAQSERLEALGAMAGGLAHDFNNLLFIINGYLQLMRSDHRIRSEADLERYVEHAGDAAERGAEIAKSLLSVTRSQPLQASAVNVGSFLQGIVPLAKQALGGNRTIDLRVGDGTLDVMVDSGQLSSSVLNLVINARDATHDSGSVLIGTDRRQIAEGEHDLHKGDYVVIDVIDDGEGMTREVLARAFEPFFSTKPVGQGSGLGLASVFSFARQSGGTATIESRPGEGTTVSIYIPAVFSDEVAAATAVRPAELGQVSRVLVVDDEQSLAGLVAGWIADMGAEVRIADSLESALIEAEEFQPDTLLSDMTLGPDTDGLDVAARLTLLNPDLVVVFMTGFSDRMHELQQRGLTTIAKPFGRSELQRALFSATGSEDPSAQPPSGVASGVRNDTGSEPPPNA